MRWELGELKFKLEEKKMGQNEEGEGCKEGEGLGILMLWLRDLQ